MSLIAVDVRMLSASGIGTYLSNMVPSVIAALVQHDFILIGDKQAIQCHSWANKNNIQIIDNQAPIYSVSEQFNWLTNHRMRADLFWSPHYNIPLSCSGKLLVTVHDVFHLAMPQFVGGIHKRLYAKAMFSMVRNKADRIICDSGFTADELIRLTGTDPRKITVIPLGVRRRWFTLQREASPHDRPYLLYVGNVKPHKNLTRLLSAFESLLQTIPHDLVIVGKKEGFITGDNTIAAQAMKLGKRIKFTGFFDDRRLEQYYAHAEALLMPSLYEGFGLPPLEAMACGCPVMVSNTASLPEVCADAAIYCDPYRVEDIAAKIQQIVSDEQLRSELRARGTERAKQFRWDEAARQTCAIIEDMLE